MNIKVNNYLLTQHVVIVCIHPSLLMKIIMIKKIELIKNNNCLPTALSMHCMIVKTQFGSQIAIIIQV